MIEDGVAASGLVCFERFEGKRPVLLFVVFSPPLRIARWAFPGLVLDP